MSQIQYKPLALGSISDGNQLIGLGTQQIQQGLALAPTIANDLGTAVRDANTATVQNQIDALNAEHFLDPQKREQVAKYVDEQLQNYAGMLHTQKVIDHVDTRAKHFLDQQSLQNANKTMQLELKAFTPKKELEAVQNSLAPYVQGLAEAQLRNDLDSVKQIQSAIDKLYPSLQIAGKSIDPQAFTQMVNSAVDVHANSLQGTKNSLAEGFAKYGVPLEMANIQQQEVLKQQLAKGAISQAQYDTAMKSLASGVGIPTAYRNVPAVAGALVHGVQTKIGEQQQAEAEKALKLADLGIKQQNANTNAANATTNAFTAQQNASHQVRQDELKGKEIEVDIAKSSADVADKAQKEQASKVKDLNINFEKKTGIGNAYKPNGDLEPAVIKGYLENFAKTVEPSKAYGTDGKVIDLSKWVTDNTKKIDEKLQATGWGKYIKGFGEAKSTQEFLRNLDKEYLSKFKRPMQEYEKYLVLTELINGNSKIQPKAGFGGLVSGAIDVLAQKHQDPLYSPNTRLATLQSRKTSQIAGALGISESQLKQLIYPNS